MLYRLRSFVVGAILSSCILASQGFPQDIVRTYKTSDTPVSRLGLKVVAGTRPPINLSLQAVIQRKVALQVSSALGKKVDAAQKFGDARDQCSATARKFDWRLHDGTTAIRDQQTCGSCFIFGAVGAFEGNWRIINKSEIDVSEQQLLECANAGTCDGGWHSNVFNALRDQGAASEVEIPYVDRKTGLCAMGVHENYKAANWDYLDPQGATASIATIKKALCEHGPIVSAVLATEEFLRYSGGIFNENAEGTGASDVNHDVTIVGWDDDEGVWITKNSWARSWGEQGYMRLKYRTNNIGYGSAWVDAVPAGTDPGNLQRAIDNAIQSLPEVDRQVLFQLRFQ
jgi:C1A family cysteine protease